MATVNDALYGLKARMELLPNYGKTPKAVYVHPDETANLKTIQVFPTIVIGEKLGDERTWTLPSFGVGRDLWRAGINVYLGNKAVMGLGPDDAAIIDLHAGWPEAIASAILAGHTLGQTADLIGAGSDVEFRYFVSGVYWGVDLYWGVHFVVPIWQEHTQTIAP